MYLLGLMLSIGAVTFTCALPMQSKDSCKIPRRFDLMELLGDSNQETFPSGHVVQYICRPGYVRLGSIKMICREGTWQHFSKGQCKKKSCGHPGDIAYGTYELINGHEFVFGARVEYSCEPGYQMISKYTTTECTATGWSRDAPHCEARLCPPVVDDTVKVLSSVFDEEYTAGHVIKLECKNPNSELDGPSQIYCTSNGTWNIDPPTCKDLCTIKNDKMEQHNIQVKNYQTHFKHNEVIEFECIPGYKISDSKNLTIKCNKGVITYPTCQLTEQKHGKNMCSSPPQVKFGEAMGVKKRVYNSGSVILFRCLSYYKPKGMKKIKCKNGVWEQPLTCLVPCILNDNYIKGNNTIVNATEKYIEHGSIVKFECLPTFRIPQTKLLNVKCLNGELKYPTCVKTVPCILNDKYIKGNNTIVNATEKYIVHGKTVKFDCLPTFRIPKPNQLNVKCLDGNLKYPTCVKMEQCAPDENTMLKNNITVNCVNKHYGGQCGIKPNNKNETIEFTCLTGYEISDHKKLKVTCHSGIIEYPKCFKITTDEITVQPLVETEIH